MLGISTDFCLLHAGKLDLNVPPFLKLDHDTEARKLVLSIEDRSEKKQKEMWGELAKSTEHLASDQEIWRRRLERVLTNLSVDFYRHNMGIHSALHYWRI